MAAVGSGAVEIVTVECTCCALCPLRSILSLFRGEEKQNCFLDIPFRAYHNPNIMVVIRSFVVIESVTGSVGGFQPRSPNSIIDH